MENQVVKLKGRKEQFCIFFAGDGGRNGAKAARMAGATTNRARITAYEYLRDPAVQERIRFLLAKAGATEEVVAANITDLATADMSEVFNNTGEFDFAIAKELGLVKFIKSIEYHPPVFDDEGVEHRAIKKIEWIDSLKANELLGRMHKMFVDRIEHDFSKLSDEELVEAAKGALTGVVAAGPDDSGDSSEAA